MQTFEGSQMEEPHTIKFMYKKYDAEENEIGKRGCNHLATADWPILT